VTGENEGKIGKRKILCTHNCGTKKKKGKKRKPKTYNILIKSFSVYIPLVLQRNGPCYPQSSSLYNLLPELCAAK
jgi:hypothetical protein